MKKNDWLVGWLVGWFGCASRARNPKGPKITPFCHQMGRHPTIWDARHGFLHRISARISPDRSRPLNLNFFFAIFGPKKWKNAIFGDIFCPCKERAVGSTGVGKNTPLGALGALGRPAGISIFFQFFFGPQNVLKRCPRGPGGPGGPWGALGGPISPIFPLFPPLWGPPIFPSILL